MCNKFAKQNRYNMAKSTTKKTQSTKAKKGKEILEVVKTSINASAEIAKAVLSLFESKS